MDWARILAYVTGTVDQELLARNEYLAAENRILKGQLNGRLKLSDAERDVLGEIGHRLGRKVLADIATMARPDMILGWYRKLVARKFDGSARRGRGRPRIKPEVEQLIIRMASENRDWGYDRIAGALANLGHEGSLSEMIVLRVLQGFSGGVMIPLAFTIVMTMLPRSKHAIGLAGYAVTATFAPAIGPTIGGYFTDNYGWPWIFYINLVPGAVMLAALWRGLPKQAMQLGLLRQGDWRGIALMAVGLTALQTVLDDGNVYDWFGSPFIVKLSLLAAVALSAFVVLEFMTPQPLVNLRLLGRRNFGLGTSGNFLLGFALYGSAYLLPQYLAVTQGFDSEQAGEVIAWTGLPQLLLIPLVPLLMKRLDARWLVGTGLLIFAASCFMNIELDRNYAGPQLLWPNIVRAIGQAMVMTPLSAIAMLGIAPQEAGGASGLFNMMRNLGGAIGTAAVETFFTKREQFHSAIITPNVSLLEPATRSRLTGLQQYFMSQGFPDPASAMHRAVIAVGATIRAQATIMGYADCFALLGVVLLVATLLVALLKKGAASGAGAH